MRKIIYFLRFNKNRIITTLIFVLVCIVCFLGVYFFNNMKDKANSIENELVKEENLLDVDLSTIEKIDNKTENISKIKVDIKGYVKNPGVYELSTEKRVIDAINMAGGLLKDADSSVLNLSKKLSDQMVIIVYSKDEVLNFRNIKKEEIASEEKCVINDDKIKNDACVEENTNVSNSNVSSKININTATLEELMKLPGIGESKANAIIEYRNKNGKFSKIEDIVNVSGIGSSVFEKIKDNITL
ncbi:MAG: helix-hairpin-helix domain-containing protein [bacterium]|nr:helix-hairpin-helix domain-containing protein [bacterium]